MTNKTLERDLEDDLKLIKEWLKTQKHLPQNIENQLLRRFIVSSNRDLDGTKKLVDLCYTMRSNAPEIFDNRDPKNKPISDYLNYGDTVPLPKVTDQNYKLIIFRTAKEPEYFIFSNVLKTILMVADIRLAKDPCITAGEVPIFDMAHSSIYHLSKISLPILKKYMMYTQEAHPVRLKQIHVINIPSYLDKLMYIVKPFMKREVAAMLHFHTSLESLYKYVPQDLLPEEYGGKAGKMKDLKEEWVKIVHDNRDYFMDETRWKLVDNKPDGKKITKSMESNTASFRSLNID